MVKKLLFPITLSLLLGFLLSGLILFINSRPTGNPIRIIPAPTISPIQVYITGSIQNPGIYSLEKGSRLSDLINLAGGLTTSGVNNFNLASKLYDGQHINLGEKEVVEDITSSSDAQFSVINSKININEAGIEELETLPGIGETRAQDIINYRSTVGYFEEIEDILNVKGIGESTFEKIKDLIAINQIMD